MYMAGVRLFWLRATAMYLAQGKTVECRLAKGATCQNYKQEHSPGAAVGLSESTLLRARVELH
jgi:hypothetical protein